MAFHSFATSTNILYKTYILTHWSTNFSLRVFFNWYAFLTSMILKGGAGFNFYRIISNKEHFDKWMSFHFKCVIYIWCTICHIKVNKKKTFERKLFFLSIDRMVLCYIYHLVFTILRTYKIPRKKKPYLDFLCKVFPTYKQHMNWFSR